MNTRRPGHAEVHATLDHVGGGISVNCEMNGQGSDVLLCVSRLLFQAAEQVHVPVEFLALMLAHTPRPNQDISMDLSQVPRFNGGDKEGKGG